MRDELILYNVETGKILQTLITHGKLFVPDEGYAVIPRNSQNIDGKIVVDGALVGANVDLVAIKTTAKSRIDAKAAKARSLVASHGYGQEMTYLAKEVEARAYVADESPTDSTYPLLLAEVGITGDTISDVAAMIVAKSNEWKIYAGSIEAIRLSKKQAVDTAETSEQVESIVAGIIWPAPE